MLYCSALTPAGSVPSGYVVPSEPRMLTLKKEVGTPSALMTRPVRSAGA